MKDEFERLLDDGFEKFYVGEWDSAEELYEAARRIRPDSGRPLVLEGRSLLMQGRLGEAQEKFYEAIRIEPDCVQAYEAFASIYGVFGGNHFDGLRCLLYALQIHTERQRTWCLVLNTLSLLNLPDIVESVANMAQNYSTGDTEADFDLRCALHHALGNQKELSEEAERFIDRFPSSRSAEMYKIMSEPAREPEEEYAVDLDEIDDCGWKVVIDEYSKSFKMDDESLREIASLWDSFQRKEVSIPELIAQNQMKMNNH